MLVLGTRLSTFLPKHLPLDRPHSRHELRWPKFLNGCLSRPLHDLHSQSAADASALRPAAMAAPPPWCLLKSSRAACTARMPLASFPLFLPAVCCRLSRIRRMTPVVCGSSG